MNVSVIRSAVISPDAGIRSLVMQLLRRPGSSVDHALELPVTCAEITDDHLGRLRTVEPELIFLDLDPDPVLGLKFARFLCEQSPSRRVVALGPMLPQEQLLAAIRAGVAEYLPKPVTEETLATSLDNLVRRVRWSPHAASVQPGQIFALFSAKGGSGTTTLATNLAIHLHRLTGNRTLLVDLDLELGETALQLGVDPRFSFLDMVRNFHRMDAELLASYIERHPSGVHLLSAPYQPDRGETVTGDQISKILYFLRQHYDFVVVDTSKSFSPGTLATLAQADRIFLVTIPELPALRNVIRCAPVLKQLTEASQGRVQLVVNRYQEHDLIGLKDVERTLGMKVFGTISNDYEAVIRSINSGTPIILNGSSRYARDLKTLSAAILGLTGEEHPRSGMSRAVVDPLARIWRRTVKRDPEVKA